MYAEPGKPPKDYGKKVRGGLGLFVLRHNGICEEVARVRITAQGHESFHRSGEFHRRLVGAKIYPVCGILDLPMAIRFQLHVNRPSCICIR